MSLTENVEEGEQPTVDGETVVVDRPDKVFPTVAEWADVQAHLDIEDGRVQMTATGEGWFSLATPHHKVVDHEDDEPDIAELYHRQTDGDDDREATIRLDTVQALELYDALGKALEIHGVKPDDD